MLTMTLMINKSPAKKIGKDLETLSNYLCVLKDNSSILKPVIEIYANIDVTNVNYMYIQDFERYYFIDDIVSVNDNRWLISAHVDVLETYKDDILNNSAIIDATEKFAKNNYLPKNDVFVANCKHKTDIVNFPSGLLETGEFILITAGG